MLTRTLFALATALLLTACDIPWLNLGDSAEKKEADGKAIGSACRYALRGIEDCYTLNKEGSKSAIFAGWKEMDQYMRDNKIEGAPSVIPPPAPPAPVPVAPVETEEEEPPKSSRAKPKH